MAYLTALYFENGTWDVFVTEGLIRGVLNRSKVDKDILGRPLPEYKKMEGLHVIKPREARRLANHLKGLPREKRQEMFQQWNRAAMKSSEL